jgi:HEAT repeat protein
LAFAAGLRPVDVAAAARLDPVPDLLLTGTTTVARWLAYLDGKPVWRANLLRLIGNQFVQPGQYPYARERLAAALAGSRDPDAAAIFERALKSPDPDVRRLSALALGVLRHAAAAEALGGMIRDVDPNVQLAAAAALGAIGTDTAFEQLARAFAFGDENVRQIAAETFAELPDVGYETLYDATRHENMDYRRAAVFGLRRMKPGWALIEVYRVFLEDDQWYVRSAAQEAIIDFQAHAAAQALSPYPALTRIEWLKEFAKRHGIKGENAAPEALSRMAATPDPKLQPVAVQAVGQLGMVSRASVLYRALLDAQPVIRDTAHRSLADIGLQYDKPLPSPV